MKTPPKSTEYAMKLILLPLFLAACSGDNGVRSNPASTPPEATTDPAPSSSEETTDPDPSSSGEASSGGPVPPLPPSNDSFDIDLRFPPGHTFSSSQMDLARKAVARWEEIIVSDIEDMGYVTPFNSDDHEWGDAHVGTVVLDSLVDDVAILMTTAPDTLSEEGMSWAYAGPIEWRSSNSLPIISQVVIAETALTPQMEQDGTLEMMFLHEIAHALGFGTSWGDDLLKDQSVGGKGTDPHFAGPLTRAAFNQAGGADYTGNKVPLAVGDDAHWRGSVLSNELMSMAYGSSPSLSLITIQTFADLGYDVDETLAEPYTLLKKTSAKPVGGWWCRGQASH